MDVDSMIAKIAKEHNIPENFLRALHNSAMKDIDKEWRESVTNELVSCARRFAAKQTIADVESFLQAKGDD